MPKILRRREEYTIITPFPPDVSREFAINFLHTHNNLIGANKNVTTFGPTTPVADAFTDEYFSTWYEITEKSANALGVTSMSTYKGIFHNQPWGIQTHIYGPSAVDLRHTYQVCGTTAGEASNALPRSHQLSEGVYLREVIQYQCNLTQVTTIKNQIADATKRIVEQLSDLAHSESRRYSMAISHSSRERRASFNHAPQCESATAEVVNDSSFRISFRGFQSPVSPFSSSTMHPQPLGFEQAALSPLVNAAHTNPYRPQPPVAVHPIPQSYHSYNRQMSVTRKPVLGLSKSFDENQSTQTPVATRPPLQQRHSAYPGMYSFASNVSLPAAGTETTYIAYRSEVQLAPQPIAYPRTQSNLPLYAANNPYTYTTIQQKHQSTPTSSTPYIAYHARPQTPPVTDAAFTYRTPSPPKTPSLEVYELESPAVPSPHLPNSLDDTIDSSPPRTPQHRPRLSLQIPYSPTLSFSSSSDTSEPLSISNDPIFDQIISIHEDEDTSTEMNLALKNLYEALQNLEMRSPEAKKVELEPYNPMRFVPKTMPRYYEMLKHKEDEERSERYKRDIEQMEKLPDGFTL